MHPIDAVPFRIKCNGTALGSRKTEILRSNVHFSLKKLHQLTENALEAINADYWKKCVLKVLKEARLYLELDETIVPSQYKLDFLDTMPQPQLSSRYG